VTHAESDILYKVLLEVGFVLLDVGQGVLVQVSGQSAVLHFLQNFSLKIKQQVIDGLLLLWRIDGRVDTYDIYERTLSGSTMKVRPRLAQ
jgi:hypothetical protein